MTPSGVWSRANRRIGLRCFRSMSGDVILLTVGLFVTVLLIARQYNDRGGSRQGRDFGELENPLREISLRLSNDQDDNGADETDAKVRSAAVRKTAPDQPRIDAVADQRSQEKVTVDPRIRRVVDSRSETCLDRQTEVSFTFRKRQRRVSEDDPRPVPLENPRLLLNCTQKGLDHLGYSGRVLLAIRRKIYL
jgi:hypothetical protein